MNQPAAAGLAAPNWGKTFRVSEGSGGSFHGVYVGSGSYISMRTAPTVDEALIGILSVDEPVYLRNTSLNAVNTTQGQLALAISGGYRGRFAWQASVETGCTWRPTTTTSLASATKTSTSA